MDIEELKRANKILTKAKESSARKEGYLRTKLEKKYLK
eukprot:CAMPEP_0202976804 /NCGR_PEP_ID=MMETSP1396-20130829/80708_1 /ASSEMBLY_ACC=CAM_ASM_000872 /TAXON_ID= /ORGANISM="Pseudokeronopsis sp., Strain Brazil" /LENGTH=37 /DNA_ID= /DNA_START= /DNA_END= /DNA_ORIENTATION=